MNPKTCQIFRNGNYPGATVLGTDVALTSGAFGVVFCMGFSDVLTQFLTVPYIAEDANVKIYVG